MKKNRHLLFSRASFVSLFILLQLAALLAMVLFFMDYFVLFYAVCLALSGLAVLAIVNSTQNPAYKLAWIIPIMLLPVFGGLFYLVFGVFRTTRRERRRIDAVNRRSAEYLMNASPASVPETCLPHTAYLTGAGFPPYGGTETEYLPSGEVAFERMLCELEKAEKFILLEYYIVDTGEMWDSLLAVLTQKAAAGVDVRLMYDDFGCMLRLPKDYAVRLADLGIQCRVFNRFRPVLSSRFNNRDHRKLCVIDGRVGFTGGYNLADEYINRISPFGHWKDNGLLLRGSAVRGLTAMFLSAWDCLNGIDEDFSAFAPVSTAADDGSVQPYGDTPLDGMLVSESVVLNLISRARKKIVITTPYLVLDNELFTALVRAAQSGVEVQIIVPYIPDKRTIYAVTQSYFEPLIAGGVRIFRYLPGFIHAKTVLTDGELASVGSVNMDYRSMHLQYECGVLLCHASCIADIAADMDNVLSECVEVTAAECRAVSGLTRLKRALLRLFAPLM